MTNTNSKLEGFHLSPQQKLVWTLQQSTGVTPVCSCIVQVQGVLDVSELQRVVHEAVASHEILRTTFSCPPGMKLPFQVVAGHVEPEWLVEDLTRLSAPERQQKLAELRKTGTAKPFELDRGPLVRLVLTRLDVDQHELMICVHALIGDPLTLSNFVEQAVAAYGGTTISTEAIQYADFAAWALEFKDASDEEAEAGRAFWQQREAMTSLTLPLEKRQSASGSSIHETQALRIAKDSGTKIEALAVAHGTSMSVVLLAAWRALLARLTGQSDFAIHVLCEGRRLDGLRESFGPYAKYLPVVVGGNQRSFSECIIGCKEAVAAAIDREDYFFPVNPEGLYHAAIGFTFNAATEEYDGRSASFTFDEQRLQIAPFKLNLSATQIKDGLTFELEFDETQIAQETAERFAGYLQRLLSFAVEYPDRSMDELDLIDEDERRQLREFNNAFQEQPLERCIHELFEDQALRTPSAPALAFEGHEISYGELNRRANQLANALIARGITANARVGLCLPRGTEMIIGLLGVLKAGAAYVPLNTNDPRDRISLQLAESDSVLVITGGGEDLNIETIDFKRDRELLDAQPVNNPPPMASYQNLAYVIYTSGSTGTPKGVAVTHGNLVNYTQFISRLVAPTPPIHFATVSMLAADLGNTSIFPSLVSGGCLHVISYDVAMDGERFGRYVSEHPIDCLKIVPSHFATLMAAAVDASELMPKQYLIFGGEALSWDLVDRVCRINHSCRIINHYGPTEATVGSLTLSVQSRDPYSATVPIGHPISNAAVYILDSHIKNVPIGVAGELYLSGAGVALGYLNRPEETAIRFLPDPFSSEPGMRMYRTGDLARYLPGGAVEFLGRVDHQVKIRGYRVELGEIEAALAEHPEVQQAIVLVRRDPETVERLVAYIATSAIRPPAADELRTFLKRLLPEYMIPSAFVVLKTLPLTPNGKVDRAALPNPDENGERSSEFVAPRSVVERETAAIWASVLKLNEVGIHDNFFDLGGHSLLATQVVSRLRKVFELDVPLRSLFESPTVASLAQSIERLSEIETEKLVADLELLSDEEAVRLLEAEKISGSQL